MIRVSGVHTYSIITSGIVYGPLSPYRYCLRIIGPLMRGTLSNQLGVTADRATGLIIPQRRGKLMTTTDGVTMTISGIYLTRHPLLLLHGSWNSTGWTMELIVP